jgi:hypothetical protein
VTVAAAPSAELEGLLEVVGVRHHSPACARVVRHAIRSRRPRHVLVEGPSDMNGRLHELLLEHTPPVALFTYLHEGGSSRSSWSPFCGHSPEWVALREAHEVGAATWFCDLPAWHPAFVHVANRYADRRGDASRRGGDAYVEALCRRFGFDDADALWDHLFELDELAHPAALEALSQRLAAHFDALRGAEPAGARDGPREAFFLRWVAWALRDARARGGSRGEGGVVLVCGGYHRRAVLAGLGAALAQPEESSFPVAPAPPEGARAGTYLVPYAHRRLDSLAGYASGMPSPRYAALAWEVGPARAADEVLARVVARLRQRGVAVSTADLVACRAAAVALARVRRRAVVARTDLLDALALTLVKEGLDVEVPWASRGPLRQGTHPVLVEIVAELAGDEVGVLARGTPRPPLVGHVEAELAAHGLTPGFVGRTERVELSAASGLAQSHVLHRLRVLEVPGFERLSGPGWATDVATVERWRIARDASADARLVEVSGHGATLEAAAQSMLESRIEPGVESLARVLSDAMLAGLLALGDQVLARLARAIDSERSLADLGAALARLVAAYEYGALFGAAGHPTLRAVIEASFERGLWLLEGATGSGPLDADVQAVSALVRALRGGALAGPAAAPKAERAASVLARRAADPHAPPALRGASLGALVAGAGLFAGAFSPAQALAAVRRTPPRELGDLLVGLFALAREPMQADPSLALTVDAALVGMTEAEFLAQLPSLRLAFAWFPPRERARIAGGAARLHGASSGRPLLRAVQAGAVGEGRAIDRKAADAARRWGLTDALADPPPAP